MLTFSDDTVALSNPFLYMLGTAMLFTLDTSEKYLYSYLAQMRSYIYFKEI